MSQRLKNKVALITGAAQGLGKEMASSMIKEGAEVILSDAVSYTHLTLPTIYSV